MYRLSATKTLDAAEATAVTTELGELTRVAVTGVHLETLNNEQSTAIGGLAADEFVPRFVIFHMEDVGVGAAANGDAVVTVGITTGGTEILGVTTLTNLINLNDRFVAVVTGLTATMPANSSIYVKVTTADTTAGADHLCDAYVLGSVFVSGT